MEELIRKIVSMAVQDLRQHNQGAIIEVIKKSEFSLEWLDHDNWNGGIDTYKLVFYLKYSDYTKIIDLKKLYEDAIMNSIDSFYKDERNIIACVEIATKIDQFVDWAAIAPKENKDSVIALITAEKDTLIKAGTGVLQIRDVKVNNEYKAKHSYLVSLLKQLGLEPVHAYNDLWDWYNDYNLRELKTYQSRRLFIKNIFEPLLNTIQNSEESALQLISYEPTGWEKVDDGVARLKEVLTEANETADFQSVGMYGRELLITLAQTVFDKEKHPSPDGTDIGKADSKRMLEAYIHYCLHKRSKEREIKFAKSSIDFSNELTHNRTATQMDAELCYNAVLSTVHIIKVLNKFND